MGTTFSRVLNPLGRLAARRVTSFEPRLTRSTRRSSVYSGRPSLAPMPYAGPVLRNDPRPIRDKTYQATCQRNITEYLLDQRFPMQLTPKTLASPTSKEFQSIFRFLITEFLDPGMVWGKSFESDCIQVMKDLRYPFGEGITKTNLGAPSAGNWASLLAMLNWLVELCKVSFPESLQVRGGC